MSEHELPTYPGILRRTATRLGHLIDYLSSAPDDAAGLRAAAQELEAVRNQLELMAGEMETPNTRQETA